MKTTVLTERDMNLLEFLWRWKLLSTAALTARFFGNCSPITAYVRLWHLREGHFIQIVPLSSGRYFVWALSPKGFLAIQNRLPELAEAGFKSENPEHDHLVTATHLGEWLLGTPKGTSFLTEQELRRFSEDHYPPWVPKTIEHRPDGYWQIQRAEKPMTIALEVEINRKRDRFYRQLAHFYDRNNQIQRVVWLVASRSAAEGIHKLIEAEVGPRSSIHAFILRNNFEKNGWHAEIHLGSENGKPLFYLLDPLPQTSSIPVWSRFLLDARKCPHRSKSYQKPTLTPNPDRGALPSNPQPKGVL